MATKLKSLKIDRVDLVPEGANSAAFVTLFKGKEGESMDAEAILEKMKPEHAEVLKAKISELEKAKETAEAEAADAKSNAKKAEEDAAAANERATEAEEAAKKAKCDAEEAKKSAGKKGDGGTVSFDEDETLLKSLPAEVQEYIGKMRAQKDAAEEVAKAAIAKEKHAEAVAKASDLKALPVETDALVSFIEKSNEETVDMLESIAKAIDSTVLSETGSNESGSFSKSANQAWSALEAKAEELAKANNVTVAKGMSMAIDEYPELYKEYLEGGAN